MRALEHILELSDEHLENVYGVSKSVGQVDELKNRIADLGTSICANLVSFTKEVEKFRTEKPV